MAIGWLAFLQEFPRRPAHDRMLAQHCADWLVTMEAGHVRLPYGAARRPAAGLMPQPQYEQAAPRRDNGAGR